MLTMQGLDVWSSCMTKLIIQLTPCGRNLYVISTDPLYTYTMMLPFRLRIGRISSIRNRVGRWTTQQRLDVLDWDSYLSII